MQTVDASESNLTATRGRDPRPTAVRVVILLLLYATVAGFAVPEFIRYPGLGSAKSEFGGENFFGDMVYGRAPKPFVTRVLVPWLIQAAGAVTPQNLRIKVEESVRRSLTTDGKPEWLYRYPFEFTVAKNIILLFAVGFAFALWWLARLTLDVPAPAADVIPVVVLFALPGFYGFAGHLYDFPALCLFTLGLALIAARRTWLYAVVFAAAVLNKETALLLTLVWAICEARRLERDRGIERQRDRVEERPNSVLDPLIPRSLGPLRPPSWRSIGDPRLVIGTALQVAVWGLIRGGLLLAFSGNPGEAISFRLVRNAQMLAVPGNWFRFRAVTDWLILPAGFNVLYVLGFVAALLALRKASRFLKDAFWIAVPVFVLTWLLGNVDEMRVYYELLPIVALVLFGGLYRLMGYAPRPRSVEATQT